MRRSEEGAMEEGGSRREDGGGSWNEEVIRNHFVWLCNILQWTWKARAGLFPLRDDIHVGDLWAVAKSMAPKRGSSSRHFKPKKIKKIKKYLSNFRLKNGKIKTLIHTDFILGLWAPKKCEGVRPQKLQPSPFGVLCV